MLRMRPGKAARSDRPADPHVAGEHDQLDAVLAQDGDDPPFVGRLPAGALRVDEDRGDAGPAGALQREGVGDIADDHPHGGGEPPGRDLVEDRLEVRPPAGGEHPERERSRGHRAVRTRAGAGGRSR